ncbi:hypothetical protein N7499_008925 [Penicillium canescens]|uniref:Uncharacterized protein n=1 Tax=Penicillium canescens TaxID=5083 RepID=A0AAD6N2I2_PENCN|nr:uncharacterized protein N7446_013897 [Penicillium canescens]KAJ5984856.1 hypothetical protein N7522_012052 [Penicillium canescens]KAJ6023532.1 hypothetical protein N7460_013927 [Penicillium canescens]KAJ6025192.1 hypothetical protein N7444_012871 [Penicillium canescens]KAJ6042831.1 hypothetical protein N7446_013897 [Penicillium canescens]KAJ6076944.1 hypothetical protein N7499_008925 [Penicillium canescens]
MCWSGMRPATDGRAKRFVWWNEAGLVPHSGPQTGGRIALATGGLYAPILRYHAGTYYIVCTNASLNPGEARAKKENFIVSSVNIWKGEWSVPVYFDFEGIDPSLFFDEGGRSYVQGSATPGPATRINNLRSTSSSGERYLKSAQYGEGLGVSIPKVPISSGAVGEHLGSFRIGHQKPYSDPVRTDEYIQHVGHCDIFQDGDGNWWATCLAMRKGMEGRYVLSRETHITPGTWDGEWLSLERVKTTVKNHSGAELKSSTLTAAPGVDYVYLRDARLDDYHTDDTSSAVTLTATPVDLSEPEVSPAFVGKRQRRLQEKSTAVVSRFHGSWAAAKLKFGIACYKDEHRYLRVYFDVADWAVVFEIANAAQGISRTTQEYRVFYATTSAPDPAWISLASVNTLEMTDPDFVGPVIGVFSVAEMDGLKVKFEELHFD